MRHHRRQSDKQCSVMKNIVDQSQPSSELHDRVNEPRRSKWSIIIDTAIDTARKKVSGAENSDDEVAPPPPVKKQPA